MIKQILRTRKYSRNILVKKKNKKLSSRKFNIIYYTTLPNVRNILHKFHLQLAPNLEHKMLFPDVPVPHFLMVRALKITELERRLPKRNMILRRCEPHRKKTFQCAKFTGKLSKIKLDLKTKTKNILYLLKCKVIFRNVIPNLFLLL